MRGLSAFLKKEFMEMIRTYKLLIFGAVFFALGVLNPVTARFTPEIIKNFMPEGMNIVLQTPGAMDSWMQFFKNIPQMGLVVMVIIFSGMMAGEWSKGTLVLVLTKGLSRWKVICAKFIAAFAMWTVSYWCCFGISYGYTKFYWDEKVTHLVPAAAFLWLFGILLIALTLLGGALYKSSYMVLLFTGLVTVLMVILNMFPQIAKRSPWMLASSGMALLEGTKKVSDFTVPLVLCGMIIVLAIGGAISIFNKKKL